jgi:hypothetical protein
MEQSCWAQHYCHAAALLHALDMLALATCAVYTSLIAERLLMCNKHRASVAPGTPTSTALASVAAG